MKKSIENAFIQKGVGYYGFHHFVYSYHWSYTEQCRLFGRADAFLGR